MKHIIKGLEVVSMVMLLSGCNGASESDRRRRYRRTVIPAVYLQRTVRYPLRQARIRRAHREKLMYILTMSYSKVCRNRKTR